MNKSQFEERHITDFDRELLNLAILCVESVHEGTLLAMVFVDSDSDAFVEFKPGAERIGAVVLAEVNWKNIMRNVEEHVE